MVVVLAFTLEPKAESFVVYLFVAKATRPEEPNKGEDVLTPINEQKHLNMCWTLQPALSIDSFQRSHACSLKANQLSLLTRLLQILDSAEEKRPTPLYRLSEFISGPWSLTSGPAPHRYRPSVLPRLCPTFSL